MGYKTILINRRDVLIKGGEIVRMWRSSLESDEGDEGDKMIIYTENPFEQYVKDWDRTTHSNVIRHPKETSVNLKSSIWLNREDCIDYALEFSEANTCKILVAKVIESINWH